MEYTKGIWRKSKRGWLIRTDEERICRVNHTLDGNGKDETALANAHLISAAPNMHELLAHPAGQMHKTDDPNMIWIRLPKDEYKQTLAKAEGRQ